MKIAFLPDGGPAAGLGHLSRCLAVAQAIEVVCGLRSTFVTADPESRAWLEARGVQTFAALRENWDVIVLDSYVRSSDEIAKLREQAKTFVVFDDTGEPPENVHWVINAGVGASGVKYATARPRGLLLGPMFHPLRSEYWGFDPAETRTSAVRNVLITLGGGASGARLSDILSELRMIFPSGCFHVLLGPHVGAQPIRDEQNIVVHRSPGNVRNVLALADIAVSGGGQTLYELAHLGIPTITLEIARNQRENIRGFSEAGAAIYVGEATMPGWKPRLREVFGCLLDEPGRREEMSEAGRQLVDGKGAVRLAKVLVT